MRLRLNPSISVSSTHVPVPLACGNSVVEGGLGEHLVAPVADNPYDDPTALGPPLPSSLDAALAANP